MKRFYSFLILSIACYFSSFGTTYYSRQSGDWSNSTTWSTVACGNATNSGTYPQAGDNVTICDGHSVVLDIASPACANLTVGGGTSGELLYSKNVNNTFTVSGYITVNAGAHLGMQTGGPNQVHYLYLAGNLTNNSSASPYGVDFQNSNSGNKQVDIIFNGATNSIVSGTGTWIFINVTMNKSAKTATLDNQSTGFTTMFNQTYKGYKGMLLTEGTYIHNNTTTLDCFDNTRYSSTSASLDILKDVVVQANQGTLKLATDGDYTVNLYGGIVLNGGTIEVGSGNGTNGIRYQTPSSGVASLTVSSGTLNVYGTITENGGAGLAFTMSGGIINVSLGTSVPTTINFYVDDVAASSTNLTGGTINILRNTSSTSSFKLNGSTPANVTVTGGTAVFGHSVTAYTFMFYDFNNATQYPHMKVSGASGTILETKSGGLPGTYKFLSLYIAANNTYDFANHTSSTCSLTSTYNGTNAFYNDGTLAQQLGTVSFTGTVNQGLAGSTTTTFYKMTVNNAAGATLYQNENVSNVATFTNGQFTLNGKTLTITTAATTGIAYTSGYIYSELTNNSSKVQWNISTTTGSHIIPFGMSSGIIPFTFNLTAGDIGNLTVSTYGTPSTNLPWPTTPVNVANLNCYCGCCAPDNRNATADRFWQIDKTGASGTADITFSYEAAELPSTVPYNDATTMRAQRYNSSTNIWVYPAIAGQTTSGFSVTVPGVTTFSPWALASNLSPLPVELLEFTATPVNNTYVNCHWATASETNNDYFTVLRSRNGLDFGSIGTVPGAGNSNTVKNYDFNDEHPYDGTSYYRLKQTDFNGMSKLSNIVAVDFASLNNFGLNVFPSPTDGNNISVNITGAKDREVLVVVRDILGQEYYSKVILVEDGSYTFALDKQSRLPAGVYLVIATSNDKYLSRKITVE